MNAQRVNALPIWSALVALSAALAIASAPWALDQPWLNFVFKPLTTVLVIAYAWPRGAGTPAVRRAVLLGLVLSLAGDVALLWPKEGFLYGLIAFLLAHLAYLVAFTRGVRFAARPLPFAVYALIAGLILWQLWPGVGAGLRIPVVAYVACLGSMAAQAAVVWLRAGADDAQGLARARTLAVGGALFMTSDALLSINKFALPLPLSGLWILASYWAAQWCIASWLTPAPMKPRA